MSDQYTLEITKVLVSSAQKLFEMRGAFYPFAATADNDGKISLMGADVGSSEPDPTKVLEFLEAALKGLAKKRTIKAFGICINVGARLPGYDENVDAICCRIDGVELRPVQVFVPFRKNQSGALEYDNPVSLPGMRSVF